MEEVNHFACSNFFRRHKETEEALPAKVKTKVRFAAQLYAIQ